MWAELIVDIDENQSSCAPIYLSPNDQLNIRRIRQVGKDNIHLLRYTCR
jgi:hypothetical protein